MIKKFKHKGLKKLFEAGSVEGIQPRRWVLPEKLFSHCLIVVQESALKWLSVYQKFSAIHLKDGLNCNCNLICGKQK
jgi:hypothetical protein